MTGRTPAMTSTTSSALARTEKMRAGRQADSARRRHRVITAINQAPAAGTEISVAGIARAADFSELGRCARVCQVNGVTSSSVVTSVPR